MRKPTICIGENKGADQLLISAFVFATPLVHFLFFLNPKFQASSLLLRLCSLICVRPVRKPHCWFSHEVAHITDLFTLFQPSCLAALLHSRPTRPHLSFNPKPASTEHQPTPLPPPLPLRSSPHRSYLW